MGLGWLAKVLSFTRIARNGANLSDVKVKPGSSANVTALHCAPAGDDSYPLPTDHCILIKLPQRGRAAVIGYVDSISDPVAAAGDKRIYSRNGAGAVVAQVHLENDGTVTISNNNGSIELAPGGSIDLNGVTIDASGNVTIPTSLNLNGKEIAEHTHAQGNDSDGDSQQNTGPNL